MPGKKKISSIASGPKTPTTVTPSKKQAIKNIPGWSVWVVISFTALLYSRSLFNGLTLMDDDYYIINNPFLKDFSWHGVTAIFSSFYSANYNPLTTLTWLFEYNLYGLNPLPYHALNVLLHLLNIWLAFKLAGQLSGKKLTALIVAILFAIHPMHVESVAWASERKDVLYAAFYLLALLAYLKYLTCGQSTKHYIITLLLFVASLFSKAAAVTLPVLLIVIDVYKGRKINTRSLLEKTPFFLLSLLFGILNIMAQGEVGAINDLTSSYGFINRIFLFTSGLAAYIVNLAAPLNLAVLHYLPAQNNGVLPWFYYASLPFVGCIIWLAAKRNPYRKEVLFGLSFFLVTIFVMLQILAVGSMLFAERYTYIPYIGLFYIVGQWLSGAAEGKNSTWVIGIFSTVVILFSVQSWARMGVWKDDNTIVADIIAHNPDVYYGYWMRGNLEKGEGNLQDALQDYTKAILLNRKFDDSYYNRGIVNNKLGYREAAIQDYNEAIAINPKSADSYNNRGWALFESGDIKSAISDFNRAILIKPGYASAHNNRGWAYFKSGNANAALQDYNSAISADPQFSMPWYNRAALKAATGDFNGAIEDYSSLLKLNPDDNSLYYYRGIARLKLKDNTGACQDWNTALGMGNKMASQMIGEYCR